MSDFEEKLVWELKQLPGVVQVGLEPQPLGLYRVDVVVAEGQIDIVWDDLVSQVDAFERALGGDAGLDLEVSSA